MKKLLTIAFALTAAVALTGCSKEKTAVTGVSLDRTALTLTVGQSETLIATVAPENADNTQVSWATGNAAVATVSGGRVTAVSAGTATVTVTTDDGGYTASCAVTVLGTFAFADDAAFDIPAATQGTSITAVNLAAGVSGGKTPYTFSASGLPAGITINASTGVISGTPTAATAAGTATVTVRDSSSPAQEKTVTIGYGAVAALTYTVTASPLTSFGEVRIPYTQPAAQTVTVTNTGTGSVTLTQPAAANYTVGTLSATTLAAGAKATFTVQPKAGLAANTYNETIAVSGTGGASATVDASFTVGAATYTISASALTSFGSLYIPYEQPAAQTVTVTNTGTGSVTLTQPTATNYTVGTLSTTTLAAGAKATFTVRPKAGLAANTYNETITVGGTNGAGATVTAGFTVTAAATYAVTVAADPAAGGSATLLVNGVAADRAAQGNLVALTATPAEGYLFDRWTVAGGGVTLSPAANVSPATFTMPEGNVSVKAEFAVPSPYTEYYGTWRDGGAAAEYWWQVTISATKFEYKSWAASYTIDELTWTGVNNTGSLTADYPKGYRLTGKLTAIEGVQIENVDGDIAKVGDTVSVWWYIHNDKGSLRSGRQWGDDHGADSPAYNKLP